MKLQIFSDIHMEAYHTPAKLWDFVTPQSPIAVVAGDIDAHKFEETVTEIATRFNHVICVYGNHEFYKKDIMWRPDMKKIPKNVHILDRGTWQYYNTIFIGATLWTDFNQADWFCMHNAKDNINDFHIITANNGGTKFTPHMALEQHYNDKRYIEMMVEQNRGKKIVVVTHFMPTIDAVHPKWKERGPNVLNNYFAANCDDLIEKTEAAAWIFGHTHDRRELTVRGVPLYCNPKGYPKENHEFTDMVIDI